MHPQTDDAWGRHGVVSHFPQHACKRRRRGTRNGGHPVYGDRAGGTAGVGACGPARALDPEGCLTCHRYKGLARLDKQDNRIHQYYVNPNYYDHALGRTRGCVQRVPPARRGRGHPAQGDHAGGLQPQSCHVIGAEGLAIVFSHDRIATMLEGSVHTRATLQEANQLLGSPIRPEQSRCLLCHDEPRFGRGVEDWVEQSAPVQRCNVCHNETFPVNTSYFYWHVFARSRPAHSHEDTVRICAVCHHNPAILKRFEHPDTIASYLSSFHGKAMLLGSEQTAVCLDCHVGRMQNVHLMKKPRTTRRPRRIRPHLADTCRSPACHPSAGAQVSGAAVHLDLATGGGIEYIVALIFVAMIVFTFGPSLMLSALEMLHIGLGREDPDTHARAGVVEQMLETRRGRRLLSRFNFAPAIPALVPGGAVRVAGVHGVPAEVRGPGLGGLDDRG